MKKYWHPQPSLLWKLLLSTSLIITVVLAATALSTVLVWVTAYAKLGG